MTGEMLFCGSVGFFSLGIVAAVLLKDHPAANNKIAHLFALSGSLAALFCALSLAWQGGWNLSFQLSLWQEQAVLRMDKLSSFFLLLTGCGGIACSIYAIGYCKRQITANLWSLIALYNAFLLSLLLVFTAQHVIFFLLAWEVMALTSCLMVNHEHKEAGVSKAAYLYFAMTQGGTAFIVMALFYLAALCGSMDFALLDGSFLTQTQRDIVFLCAFIGFGAKAGLMPLHIWLPQAHPAAPSHVSALMSGVMLKTAVYGMFRVCLEFMPQGPFWWGALLVTVGLVSLLLGVLYAFLEKDLKRLLAYSSVENIGLIFLAFGIGMVFASAGNNAAASFAWTAALCHALNHAFFKTLAFLSVGAVYQATHTKNADLLGGLNKKMPYTTCFFLVAVLALSALPPLNGFWGEWLIFQAVMQLAPTLGGLIGKLVPALLLAGIGMAGVLAAACFVEAFGIGFLAKARSQGAEEAREASLPMLIGQGLLVAGCLALAVLPQPAILWAASALPVTGAAVLNQTDAAVFAAQLPGGYGIDSRWLIASLAAGVLLGLALTRLFGKERVVSGETWTCGIIPDRQMEYTASGFSQAAKRAFRRVAHPHEEVLVNNSEYQYHGRKLVYEIRLHYLFSTFVYEPLQRLLVRAAQMMKLVQGGSVQLYVGYIFVVTVLVLLWSGRW